MVCQASPVLSFSYHFFVGEHEAEAKLANGLDVFNIFNDTNANITVVETADANTTANDAYTTTNANEDSDNQSQVFIMKLLQWGSEIRPSSKQLFFCGNYPGYDAPL